MIHIKDSVRKGIFLPGQTYTPYSYEALRTDLLHLQKQYPLRLRIKSIGKSWAGRDLLLAQLGNPSASCRAVIAAGIHAREHITSRVAVEQIRQLLCRAEYDPYLAERFYYVRLDCIPMLNPDGTALSQQGLRSVKNASVATKLTAINGGCTDFTCWKANLRGVDLNRNFDADFSSVGGPRFPSPEGYRGPKAFSEKESAAVAAFIRREKHRTLVAYHARGEEIYWYFGQPQQTLTRDEGLARRLAETTGYRLLPPEACKGSAGGLKDWFVQKFARPGFTLEMGHPESTFPLEDAQLPRILQQLEDVPLLLLNEAAVI